MQRSTIALFALLSIAACSLETPGRDTDADTSSGSAPTDAAQIDAPAEQNVVAPLDPQANACEPCPPTMTPCDALDLACEPLGVSEGDCLDLHDLCHKGKEKYSDQVCKFAVTHSTNGDAAAVCACAYTCSF